MTGKPRPAVASQHVADLLAERILSGRLGPDAWIKQDELATELGISRIPIRDALRILEARGLVSLRANAGARVTRYTERDIEIWFQVRERVEPLLLAQSLPDLMDADVEQMRDLLARIDATDDADEYLALDRAFFWTAYGRHGAPGLAQMVERLWDSTHVHRRIYARIALKNGGTILRTEHALFFGAIERRELATAEAALVLHLRRTQVGLIRYGHLLDAPPVVRSGSY